MLRTRPRADVLPALADAAPRDRFIYIACPWAPVGGGMYKVAWGRIDGGLAGVHVNMGERMSLFRKGVLIAACRAMGVPVVLHLHAQMEPFYRTLPALLQRLTRAVFLMASGVVVIGPAARRFVLDVLRVPAARVDIIINGVPEAVTAGDRAPGDGPRRLLFVGNLSDRKGLLDLLRALASPDLDTSDLKVTLGEIPALLTDGCNALFVAARDPASLAAGLQRVLYEPGLRETLARNGRELYEERFSLRGFFARVASVHRRHFGTAAQFGEPPN